MSRLPSDQAAFYAYYTAGHYLFRWTCVDSDLWKQILVDFKSSWPHWTGRSFDGTANMWRVSYQHRARLATWADAWFAADAQEWIEEEPGERAGSRSRHTAVVTLDDAYQTLHLLPSAPPEVVAAAHRVLIKLHHPDVAGGDHDTAVAINQAMEAIRAHQARRAS